MILNRCFFVILVLELIVLSVGLERARLNPNAANRDFLLSESGQNSQSPTQQEFPSLPTNNKKNAGHSGRVHDLVNFYDNKGKGTTSTTKPNSYSSILSGSKKNQPSVSNDALLMSSHDAKIGENKKTINPLPAINNKPRSNLEPRKPEYPEGHNNGESVNTENRNKPTVPSSPSLKPTFTDTHFGGNKGQTNINNAGNNQHGKLPQTPTKPTSKPTFSSILSGSSNDPTNANNQRFELPHTPTKPTNKPSFSNVASGGSTKPSVPSSRPTGTPVLPSSILANQGNRPANGNAPTDMELQSLSEELLRKDTNNVARLITVNFQQKTTADSKEDKAPQPLFTIPASVFNGPTIQKFIPLLDNYERDTLVNEYVTPQERNEENAFMDAIMQTQVIRQLMTFLREKGYVTPDPRQQRDYLKQLWFNLYSRGKGKISSSGFEHVFVSELKNNGVSGLHNWLYFAKEESTNRLNYLGYLKYNQLNDKGTVIKLHFNQQGVDKPVGTMFIGTSPELEIALYSLCFITRADRDCPLKLGGKHVSIVTHTFRYRSKNMIGSAYPVVV